MRKNQLTRQGFMELNLMEATERDGDPSDLWVTLEAMGYNQQLELVDVRRVQSESFAVVGCAENGILKATMKELLPLALHQACPFLIDVHCELDQPSIQPLGTNSGHKLLNQALQKSITSRTGAKALRGQESVFVYTYRGEHRVSSLIANKVPSTPTAESQTVPFESSVVGINTQ